MKKIFLMLAAVCAFAACDPVQEDISNAGHISADELKAMTVVAADDAGGQTGNVITCTTSAPVNAKWTFDGKMMVGNYAKKKMTLGEHEVVLTALCADGTELTVNYPITCQTITDPLTKYYIYQGEPLVMGQGDAAAGRFSDNEGKGLPYLSDDVYFGKKTLIFDLVAEGADGGIWGEPAGPAMVRIMNGWWAATYADEVEIKDGPQLWELQITDEIAADCAKGGDSKDLDILVRRGTLTINAVYYEE